MAKPDHSYKERRELMAIKDLTGRVFERLTVKEFAGINRAQKSLWLCSCSCEKEIVTQGGHLTSGHTRSCGCLAKEMNKTSPTRFRPGHKGNLVHGHHRVGKISPEWQSWNSMITRCTYPNRRDWKWYGGRGITVSERWLNFENFLADMGPRPKGTTIDRENNDGNYEPGNCRWATWDQQVANKRQRKRMKPVSSDGSLKFQQAFSN